MRGEDIEQANRLSYVSAESGIPAGHARGCAVPGSLPGNFFATVHRKSRQADYTQE